MTTPTISPASVTAVGGSIAGPTFGDTQRALIQGIVFNDINGNGILDAGETGIVGRTVFLDLNKNGSQDAGEPTAITGARPPRTAGPLTAVAAEAFNKGGGEQKPPEPPK